MTWLRQLGIDLRVRAAGLFARGRLRARVDEEMRFHVEMRTARLIEEGVPPDEAARRAARAFGRPLALREQSEDAWRYGALDVLRQDLRSAVRALRRTPLFTVVTVLTLALGIGANSAIFSLIDRLLLRPLPVEAPDALVLFGDEQPYPRYRFFRDRGASLFRSVAAFTDVTRIAVDGGAEGGGFAEGRLVSATYFDLFGVTPHLGRVLNAADERAPGAHPAIVISHAFWRRYFNADPSVLGRTIRLGAGAGDLPFAIVGVAPAGFTGETVGERPDFWAPVMMLAHFIPGRAWLTNSSTSWLTLMARVAPGVSRARAQAGVDLLLRQALTEESGATLTDEGRSLIARERVELLDGVRGRGPLRGRVARPLALLMAMVALVLCIACGNLATLQLARGSARGREIALRLALGASRARVMRQLATESALLGLIGGADALAAGVWGGRALFAFVTEGSAASRLDVAVDPRLFLFTALLTGVTVIAFGILPALRATRAAAAGGPRLEISTQRQEIAGARVMTRGLIVIQLALSIVLLAGAALFARTLYNITAQDYGYAPQQLVLMRVNLAAAGHAGEEGVRTGVALLDAIRALPGVQAAALSENGLFSGTESGTRLTIEGYQATDERARQVRFDQVGPGYFAGVGIPLIAGRDFTEADGPSAPRVAIVNEQLARFYFGARSPIGARIRPEFGPDAPVLTVIGVTRDARDHDLRDAVPRRFYLPMLQTMDGAGGAKFMVRGTLAPAVMAKQLRDVVARVAPGAPIEHITPVETLVARSLLRERTVATLSALLGLVAALLACLGVHGMLTWAVARRTNEMGIRLAMGAPPRAIVWLVVRETLLLVLAGASLGVPVALALGRYVETLLFGLRARDAATLTIVVALMTLVALIATLLPARRAATIDPLRALRTE